jgi:ATP-dependent Clp protease adaptor protein ClpS
MQAKCQTLILLKKPWTACPDSINMELQHPQLFEKPFWEEEEDVLVEDDISTGKPAYIVVYNDDFNTFEWVIECFIDILKHSHEQAEQLAILIHFKGKATVKTGPRKELEPYCSALLDRGLSAELEGGDGES